MPRQDQKYITDLCDDILGDVAHRECTFDFLLGDPGKNGQCKKLPVDAYYPRLNLVIEYHERQHTESISLFDNKMTISGVTRSVQRKMYDKRRQDILPKHGIRLIILHVDQFKHKKGKKLSRVQDEDKTVIINVLKKEGII